MNAAERERLTAVLRQRFDLDAEEAARLIAAAIDKDLEAIDLYAFTSVLNRTLDDEERRRVVEMMWEVVYADGRVDELEDNVVWRAADLLHVPSRDRIALKHAIAETCGAGRGRLSVSNGRLTAAGGRKGPFGWRRVRWCW